MTIKQTLKNTFQKRESDSHFSFIYIRKHFIKVSFYYQVLFSKHYFSLFKYLHITLYEPSGCFFNSSNDNIMCVCEGKKRKETGPFFILSSDAVLKFFYRLGKLSWYSVHYRKIFVIPIATYPILACPDSL